MPDRPVPMAGWMLLLLTIASCAPTPTPSSSTSATRAIGEAEAYAEAERVAVPPNRDLRPGTEIKVKQNLPAKSDSQTSTQQQVKAQDVVQYELAPETKDEFVLEDGFQLMSLDDFEAFQADSKTWTAMEDGLRSTGKPKGYLYSKDSYQNFTWRLEYRFERPTALTDDTKFKGNTGFMIHINGEHKIWPVSLEVQGKHSEMAAIKSNGGAAPVTVQDDDAARQLARRPVGQWNRLEIVSLDGSLSVTLNDTPISRSEPNFLSAGQIGIQAEDHPFVVRRMRIRPD